MKIQAPVREETKKIAIGVGLLSVLMVLVFILIGRFDLTVLWGTIFGGAYAILNFFMMAMTVQQAAEKMNGVQLPSEDETEKAEGETETEEAKEELPQQKSARSMIQRSYYLRMTLTAVMAIAAVKLPFINAVAAIAAQFFPRIAITALPLLQKVRKGE